ncbi:MAG: signal peptide peptidase SppA [Phycisphaerales bacterium]|nr:signal peptide peptidase SppA [Phycisphaerales bacterium]
MTRLLALCLVAALGLAGCTPVTLSFTFGKESRLLSETTVVADDAPGKDKVAMIDVRGLIADRGEDSLFSSKPNPVDALTARLEKAEKDPAVRAVILRINSPGGGVTASDMMYREVRRFRERSGKPVVASLGEVAASGGYYLALSADRIIAEPTSITGSVGVIIPTINVSEGLGKIGIHARNLTSGPNKDMGDPLTPPKEQHYALLQGLVNEFYAKFRGLVVERRPGLVAATADEVTDGRVVSGARAVEVGLADATGGVRDAFEAAKTLAGVRAARLVKYHSRDPGPRSPYGTAATNIPAPAEFNLIRLDTPGFLESGSPAAYYLWSPQP